MRTFRMRHDNLDWLVHVMRDDMFSPPWDGGYGEVIKRLMIERWRAWRRDEWTYVAVGVQLLNLDGEVVDDRTDVLFTIGGIEGDDEEGIMMAARDSADSVITTYDVFKVAMMRATNSTRENDDEV